MTCGEFFLVHVQQSLAPNIYFKYAVYKSTQYVTTREADLKTNMQYTPTTNVDAGVSVADSQWRQFVSRYSKKYDHVMVEAVLKLEQKQIIAILTLTILH